MFRYESQQTIPTNLYWRNYAISKTYQKNNNGGGVLIGLTLLSQPAQAALITFNFDDGDDALTTVTKTVGGVTLTANSFSPTTTTTADSDGLCFAGTDGFCPNLTSFNLSFSAPVQLISYQTGFISLNTATLTFTQGANSSVQTSFVDESTIAFTNQFGVAANQVISVTATNLSPSGSSLQIRQLTIDDAVTPVPEPLTLLGATAAMGIGAAFKRRSGKAKHK